MCPYCGEDVPDDSKSCWKCGTEISGNGEAAAGPEAPGFEQRRREPDRPEQGCPHCGASVPAMALRCNECGRPVRKHSAARNWIPAVYAAFGIVLLSVLFGFGWAALRGGPKGPDPGRDRPLSLDHQMLTKIYLDSRDTDKLRELWKERHQGRFVEWEMRILEVQEDGTLLLAGSNTATAASARLVLKDPRSIELHGLSEDKLIAFSAALRDFEEGTFLLDLGVISEQ